LKFSPIGTKLGDNVKQWRTDNVLDDVVLSLERKQPCCLKISQYLAPVIMRII